MQNNLKVIYLPIAEVVEYPNNARTHSPSQVRQIAGSMLEFGFTSPILIDKYKTIIAGHGRVLGAQEIGLDVIPAIRADHLSPAQVRAYRLADNKIAENAGWNDDLLRIELDFLTSIDIDFQVDLTGFSTTEVDLRLGSDIIPSSDDDVIELSEPSTPVSQPGDIWCLNRHKVFTGDCRNPETIDQLMDGELASMVLSDPPYNLKIDGVVSGLGKTTHREFPVASGELSVDAFTEFLTDSLQQSSRASVDGALQYFYMDFRHMGELLHAGSVVYKQPIVNLCVWKKTNAGMGSLYRSQHELIFIFKNGTAPHQNNIELGKNGRYRTNIWEYAGANSFGADRDESLAMHPTVKPVQMLADAILDTTCRGDIIFDGFLGSGSTLIAAERTGRICHGVELDCAYVDLVIRRWESISGERATLSGTNMNIDQLAIERGISREVTA